jgi:hypothetical protein
MSALTRCVVCANACDWLVCEWCALMVGIVFAVVWVFTAAFLV